MKTQKKILLQEAYAILQECSAVIVDNEIVTYPCLLGSGIENDENNEFLTLSWDYEDCEYQVLFNEGDNPKVEVSDSSMRLRSTDNRIVELTILEPRKKL